MGSFLGSECLLFKVLMFTAENLHCIRVSADHFYIQLCDKQTVQFMDAKQEQPTFLKVKFRILGDMSTGCPMFKKQENV